MNKQEIMDLLALSENELKTIIQSKNIKTSEFCKTIEDMKLNSLLNKNGQLFTQLAVLKTSVIDIVSIKEIKPCNETKFRALLQTLLL